MFTLLLTYYPQFAGSISLIKNIYQCNLVDDITDPERICAIFIFFIHNILYHRVLPQPNPAVLSLNNPAC